MSRLRKLICLSLAISVALSGCSARISNNDGVSHRENITSYTETIVGYPEGALYAFDMKEAADGSLQIAAGCSDGSWISVNRFSDETGWSMLYDSSSFQDAIGEERSISSLALYPDGSIILSLNAGSGSPPSFCSISNEGHLKHDAVLNIPNRVVGKAQDLNKSLLTGEAVEIDVWNTLTRIMPIDSNAFLALDLLDNLYLFSSDTGQALATYDVNKEAYKIEDITYYEGLVIVIMSSLSNEDASFEVATFELASGEATGGGSLQAAISNILPQGRDASFAVAPLFCERSSSDLLEVLVGNDIYQYSDGKMDLLVSGESNSLSDADLFRTQAIALDGGSSVYVEFFDGETPVLIHYSQADENLVYDSHLEIFSLEENLDLARIVSSYRRSNPHTEVELTLGVPAGSNLSEEEALSSLVSRLQIGEGPDIILLDGLSVYELANNGYLTDMAPVIERLRSEKEYFDCGFWSYLDDGKVLAVSACFTVPSIVATEGILDHIETINDIESLFAEDEGQTNVLGCDSVPILYEAFYPDISPSGDKIDQEAISYFLDTAKNLIRPKGSLGDTAAINESSPTNGPLLGGLSAFSAIKLNANSILLGSSAVNVGMVTDAQNIGFAYTAIEHAREDLMLRPLSLGSGGVSIPAMSFGFLASGETNPEAEFFIKYLLSDDVQLSNELPGIPVSVDALISQMSSAEGYIVNIDGTVYSRGPFTAEEVDLLIGQLRTLTPVVKDLRVTQAIDASLKEYMDDLVTLDQAVESVVSKTS